MIKNFFYLLLCFFVKTTLFSQSGIQGVVYDKYTNNPLPYANVFLQQTKYGTNTNKKGEFIFKELSPGLYNLEISFIGYKTQILYEIETNNLINNYLTIELEPSNKNIKEVKVSANSFEKNIESPLSLLKIGVNEIKRNPGGNRDISKVIQSLPGVSSDIRVYRNDLIIRGGAPNENKFILDGIPIPSINHFSTQGSTGGPVGLLNINFINNVDFYTSAFPVNSENALSSVMVLNLKDGNKEKLLFDLSLGSSEAALTLEGPFFKKNTFIASFRRSYLQYLFKSIGLPFLPTYNDFQFKTKINIKKNYLTLIGLGTLDQFELNKDANETKLQRYQLGFLPVNEQWSYTVGAKYTFFKKNNFTNIILSRSHLNNVAEKYYQNDEENTKIIDYKSNEIYNTLKTENIRRTKNAKIISGFSVYNIIYDTKTQNQIYVDAEPVFVNYDSNINFLEYNFFTQYSSEIPYNIFTDKNISFSFGNKFTGSNYSNSTKNLIKQMSYRFSSSIPISEYININLNTGSYYQLPPLTVLGYKENGEFVNRSNNITYMKSVHYVSGIDFNTQTNNKTSLEFFYKRYSQYPFLLRDSISLATFGADFGVVGNEPAVSNSKGRSYGLELVFQQKLFKGFYGIANYTLVYSQVQDKRLDYISTNWDNRHIFNLNFGKKFKKNWEIGFKWRFLGGAPYTPYDLSNSMNPNIWANYQQGILNYDLLNTERLPSIHQLDFRIDKVFYFKNSRFNIYLDVQNLYNFQTEAPPYLSIAVDENNEPLVDENQNFVPDYIDNIVGRVLPSIGFQFNF